MKKLILFLICLASTSNALTMTITCAHKGTCLLTKELLQTHDKKIFIEPIIQNPGDPHHYHPTQNEVKQLLKAENLILPPLTLWPWIKKIIQKKKRSDFIVLDTLKLDTKNSDEKSAHFWLHPKLLCMHKENLKNRLNNKWKLSLATPNCDKENIIYSKFENLKETLNKQKIVLTHDALSLFLNEFSNNILSLRSSHHSDHISPKQLKTLSTFLKDDKKPVIWILEDQIAIPLKIKKKIRKNDLIIKLNTNLSHGEDSLSILKELLTKFEEIK